MDIECGVNCLKSLSMKGERKHLEHGIMDEGLFLSGRNMSMLKFWLAWSGWKELVGYAGVKKHKNYWKEKSWEIRMEGEIKRLIGLKW